jgi:GT2 family glycosyltransferase/tetratricopeptide (TPR) repeat protein
VSSKSGRLIKKLARLRRTLRALGTPATDRQAGDAARNRRAWAMAGDAYARHVAVHERDTAIWVQLGHMRKEEGAMEAAAAAYAQALELAPDDADLLLSLGHFHKVAGELDIATRYYLGSFESDGNAAAAHELAGPLLRPFIRPAVATLASSRASAPRFRSVVPQGRIDRTDGFLVSGWASDPADGDEPTAIAFYQDGRLVGECDTDLFRPDISLAGLGSAISGFEAALDLDFSQSQEVEVVARFRRTGQMLANSPATAYAPQDFSRWLGRTQKLDSDELALVKAVANQGLAGRLSIVMPVYNTRPAWLREALASVMGQWCDAWELICVDDCSPDPRVREVLAEAAARDPRVRLVLLDKNVGIATATNHGIAAAEGDYIGFFDHDDMLEPDAVGRMLQAACDGADLLYSDEIVTGEKIDALRHVIARPAFSYDYYLSHPYFVHFVVVRASIAKQVRWDETMAISADVDFMLRMFEQARSITHVPAALYRWRTHGGSAGHSKADQVTEATVGSLNRHLARLEQPATARAGPSFNCHRIDFADDPQPTAIIIPTKNRHDLLRVAIESLQRTVDTSNVEIVVIDHQSDDPAFHRYMASIAGQVTVVPYRGAFNFAAMNNAAVTALGERHRYFLFMNNDVEAIEPGWLEHMRGLCARPDVGAVGATLLYPDNRIQHSGVVMGLNALVDHAHKFRPFRLPGGVRNPGYNLSLSSTRDYSAVTAACMMVRREVFAEMGGFDEQFEIGFNDVDLCLRLGAAGYAVLNDAHAVLFHHESATRADTPEMLHPEDARRFMQRWAGTMGGADPFYSPMLSLVAPHDHELADLDRGWALPRTRAVSVRFRDTRS